MKGFARFLGLAAEDEHATKAAIDDTMQDEQMVGMHTVDISEVIPNPYQPRKLFNDESLQELAESIREHGVIQPLLVRRNAY